MVVNGGAQMLNVPIDRPVIPIDSTPYPIGRPPALPNSTVVFPNLKSDFVFIIASQLANLIKARANNSTAHMCVYNEQSANNWHNENFSLSVNYTYYYMAIGLSRGLYVEGNRALEESIQKMLAALTTIAITRYPNVASTISADLLQQARQNVPAVEAMFNEITQEVARLRQQSQYQNQYQGQSQYPNPYQNQPQGFYGPQGMQGAPGPAMFGNMNQPGYGFQNNINRNVQQPYNPYSGQQFSNANQNNQPAGTGLFHSYDQPRQAAQTSKSNTFSKYAYLSQTNNQQAPVAEPNVVNLQAGYRSGDDNKSFNTSADDDFIDTVFVKEEVDFEGADPSNAFVSTDEQPFPIAVNSRTEARIAIKTYDANKSIATVRYTARPIQELQFTEEDMDRNRHYITPASKRLNTFEPPVKSEDVNFTLVRDNAGDSSAVNTSPNRNVLRKKTREYISATVDDPLYMEELVFAAQSTAKQSNEKNTSYFVGGKIKKTLVTVEDHSKVLEHLASMTTFAQLSREMQLITGNTDSSKDLLELIACLDNFLKKKLMGILRYRLGAMNIVMDSFMEDAKDIFSYLEKTYGGVKSSALQAKQREFISNYFNPELSEAHINIAKSDEDKQNNDVCVYNLIETASVTYVDVTTDELDINIVRNMSNRISESSLPELYDLIDDITSFVDDQGNPYATNFLLTADGGIFEVSLGYTGSKFAHRLIRAID